MPSVSVAIATYNSESFIEKTLDSILAQTWADFEVIVIDDCSKDHTWEILERYAKREPRLRIDRNEVNMNYGAIFGRLLSASEGEFIALIGHDDIWEKNHLEACVRELKNSSEISACFGGVRILKCVGTSETLEPGPEEQYLVKSLTWNDLSKRLFHGNFLFAPAGVFRRDLVAGWNTIGSNDSHQDYALWLHLLTKGPFAQTPGETVQYRVHGNNLSVAGYRHAQANDEFLFSRLGFLYNSDFFKFIGKQSDPDACLLDWVKLARQTLTGSEDENERHLRLAMHQQKAVLKHFKVLDRITFDFAWRLGAFTKAIRDLLEPAAISDPSAFPRVSRFLIYAPKFAGFAGKEKLLPATGLIRVRSFAGFHLVKVRHARPRRVLIPFDFCRTKTSILATVERHIYMEEKIGSILRRRLFAKR